MNWIEYHSIKELPETIWAKIAGDNPCLSADFMEIVENLHPKDSYNYAVLYDNKEVVGVIFLLYFQCAFIYINETFYRPRSYDGDI